MLNFNINSLLWFGLIVIFIIIILLISKWGIKRLVIVFNADQSCYKIFDIIYSILKILLVAASIIFITSRIFFQDFSIKSYNTDMQNQMENQNKKLLDEIKPRDPNEIERLNQQHELEHTYEVEDRIREKKRKTRDEFQQYLDTL